MNREFSKNQKIKFGKFKFIKAWSFPTDIKKFAEYLLQVYKTSYYDDNERCFKDEPSLHVFCGDSFLGDIRVDIEQKKNVTLVSNYKDLPLKLGVSTQTRIILDPPWQIPPVERQKISYVIRDLLKSGGFAIFNCTWNPWCVGFDEPLVWIPWSHFNNYLDGRFWVIMKKL